MTQALISNHAVLGTGADADVPIHYGAPLREQRALLMGKAVVDLGQFEILEVGGEDRHTWLTTITSQIFTNLQEADSTEVTVLSPQGRVEHFAQVVTGADSFFFIVDAGARAGLRAYFQLMTFANRIDLIDRDDLRILGFVQEPAVLRSPEFRWLAQQVAIWRQSWPEVSAGGVAYGPDPQFADPWQLALYPEAQLRTAIKQGVLQASHFAGFSSAEAIRVANHRPRFANEVDANSIPHELDLLRTAVHTDKGCYRGQETVAKVLNLGQPPRRLVMLHLDGSQDVPVPNESAVYLGAKLVGKVTTSVLHADEGPIALAVIKRVVPVDTALTVRFELGEHEMRIDANQEVIVQERQHAARPHLSRLA